MILRDRHVYWILCCQLLPLSLVFSQVAREKRIIPVDAAQQQSFTKQIKVALLVGIGTYPEGSGLNALKYPARDVSLLGEELEKQGYLVRRLVDSNASRGVVRRALAEMADPIEPGQGTFIFYYSGHGFAQEGVNYLATFGAAVDDLRSEGLAITEVESLLARSKARQRILWLDACRNDPASATRSTSLRSFEGLNASEGLKVLFSTRAGHVSYENDELHQGVFTHFLVRGLRGEAAGADGLITFRDLSDYVISNVRRYGVEHGQVQIPYEAGESSGDFILSRDLPAVSATADRPSSPAPVMDPRPTPSAPASVLFSAEAVHVHHTPLSLCQFCDRGHLSVSASEVDFDGTVHHFKWQRNEIQESKLSSAWAVNSLVLKLKNGKSYNFAGSYDSFAQDVQAALSRD